MSSTSDQDERPVALLMDNTGEFTIVVEPWCRWLPRETLDTTEGGVLDYSWTHV